MIDVLVVDDDFYVAEVNAAYVSRIPGFRVTGKAHSAAEAMSMVEQAQPDLMMLDHYLPDENGLSLVRRLQREDRAVDVIMVTAAGDVSSVRTALRYGILHYLVKPFSFPALRAKLEAYAQVRRLLEGTEEIGQEGVDAIFGGASAPDPAAPLPKGYSVLTSKLVHEVLQRARQPLSAQEVAARAGLSRSTAQRYLKYMEESGRARLTLKYGDTGRPEHHYEC